MVQEAWYGRHKPIYEESKSLPTAHFDKENFMNQQFKGLGCWKWKYQNVAYL